MPLPIPKHRHELTLSLGAHTLDELQHALQNIAIELREHGNVSVSGSPSAAGHFEHVVDVNQTREKYVEQLEAYLADCKRIEGSF